MPRNKLTPLLPISCVEVCITIVHKVFTAAVSQQVWPLKGAKCRFGEQIQTQTCDMILMR